jgi:hypothetical protein
MFRLRMATHIRSQAEKAGESGTHMRIWSKLQNPFALVVQGFAAGGLLFWTTRADAASLLTFLHLSF